MSKITHIALMTLLGLGALAAFAVLFVFAASLALLAMAGLGVATLFTLFTRRPLHAVVRCPSQKRADSRADGLFEAKKEGNTWVAYK